MMQVFEPHLVGVSQRNTWVTSVGATNSHDAANSESYVTKIVRTDPMPVVEQEVLCESGLFSPNSSRSLLCRGSYIVSWSTNIVSTTRHTSTNCCHSRLFRANRDTSRAATAPTLPIHTSATMRSKPDRVTVPAAERPRSSSMTSMSCHPSMCSRCRIAYCSF